MGVFTTILQKLIPLYALIFIGFIAGRLLHVKKESVATLLIYVIAPMVVFHGIATVQLDPGRLTLPVLFFTLCCLICLTFYKVAGIFWRAPTKNILAFAVGSGNTGYFGLPVTAFLFGPEAVGLTILSAFGFILYENTLGFFITARGHHTIKESLLRVLKLPTVYAFALGVIVNLSGASFDKTMQDFGMNFRGAYSVLGMMLIGLGVASQEKLKLHAKFVSLSFAAKFLVWPLVVSAIIYLDRTRFHLYDPLTHNVMFLMAIVPLPANSVAVATELKSEPEKAAMAVLLSTLFALFYIPLMTGWFLTTGP